ncbi:MAG: hypothetical protein R3F31_12180 [Verrucomicrobiales bacterium]
MPTDVYGIANLDPKATTILLRGEVTEVWIRVPKRWPVPEFAHDASGWLRIARTPDGKAQAAHSARP